jgi:isoamylase
MNDQDWSDGLVKCIGMLLHGGLMEERDERGQPILDDVMLLLINAHYEPIPFTLPGGADGPEWEVQLDTANPRGKHDPLSTGSTYELQGRSIVVLCQPVPRSSAEANAMLDSFDTSEAATTFAPFQEGTHTIVGNVMTIASLSSPEMGNTRDIKVYLPPSYVTSDKRYPVIYMHDGQNLFDEATAFQHEWGVDETMEALAEEGIEALVVGIPNMGADRLNEYSPFIDAKHGGGQGEDYLSFIIGTLKPYIDGSFRTLPQREHTGIFGSSMGGLISLYAFFRYPHSFGFAGAMSPSLWFAEGAIYTSIEEAARKDGRIYLDSGTDSTEAPITDLRRLRDLLNAKGYDGDQLRYVEDEGAAHNERAWGARLAEALRYLLAPVPVGAK